MDFDRWLNRQAQSQAAAPAEDKEELLHFRCVGCGKEEERTRAEYENGDTGWYCDSEEHGMLVGVCGGGPHCLP